MADIPWGLAAAPLSESDWKKINSAVNLPDEGRSEIEGALALFRYFHGSLAQQPRAGATRKKLLRIAQRADDLLTQIIGNNASIRTQLSGLDNAQLSGGTLPINIVATILSQIEPDTLRAFVEIPRNVHAGPTPKRDAFELLCRRCWAVEQLRNWAVRAAQSLPSEATGAHKKAEIYQWLVSQLDSILFKHTKRHVTRSYKEPELKDYVTVCFNIADPTIGSGSIDEAMKAYISLKPPRGEIADRAES